MSAVDFVAHARSFIGQARWRHIGRKPWALDCVGLLVLSGHAAGLKDQDIRGYGREPWDDLIRKTLRGRFGDPFHEPALGDIAVVRWVPGDPTHLAIVGDHHDGGFSLIHMDHFKGCIEHALSGPYLDCIVEYYRPWPASSSP